MYMNIEITSIRPYELLKYFNYKHDSDYLNVRSSTNVINKLFYLQKICEILSLQGATDDELVSRHLISLAEKTVREIVYSMIIEVVLCTEKW